MLKRTWVDVGIAVLGLFLVCSAAEVVAQTEGTTYDPYGSGDRPAQGSTEMGQGTEQPGSVEQTPSTGQVAGSQQTTDTGQVAGAQQATDVESQQRLEIARLRVELARLQQELARMRSQLAQTGSGQQGVGGAGTEGAGIGGAAGTSGGGAAGTGDSNVEAPSGAAGVGEATGGGEASSEGVGGGGRASGTQAAPSDTSRESIAVANVIYTGRVRSVSKQQLVLDIEGGPANTLSLANNVRVFRGQEQLNLKSLREGTLVRASADLYARGNPVTEIEVLPPSK